MTQPKKFNGLNAQILLDGKPIVSATNVEFDVDSDKEDRKKQWEEIEAAIDALNSKHTMMRDNDYSYPFGYDRDDGDEQPEEEEGEESLDEQFDFIKVKELAKIKLDPGEALMVKLPKDTPHEEGEAIYQYITQMLGTRKVLVFIGDIELSKIDYSAHAPQGRHPLYDK